MTARLTLARCWPCQFNNHYNPPKPHTWMDSEDAEHAGRPWPLPAEIADAHPCACACADGPGGCVPLSADAADALAHRVCGLNKIFLLRRAERAEAERDALRQQLVDRGGPLMPTDEPALGPGFRAAVERTRAAIAASGCRTVNIRQVISLLSLTWPDGNYEGTPDVESTVSHGPGDEAGEWRAHHDDLSALIQEERATHQTTIRRAERAEAERDALKAALARVRADCEAQRPQSGDPVALGVWAQARRTLRILGATESTARAADPTQTPPSEETTDEA